jgi:hypothetical protein
LTIARRATALLLFIVAAGFVWIAALTPLRSAEIAELDAEARQLGEEWAARPGNLSGEDEQAERLVRESNERFREARALEPPLDPIAALGAGLLAVSGGVALWPSGRRDDERVDADDTPAPADTAP